MKRIISFLLVSGLSLSALANTATKYEHRTIYHPSSPMASQVDSKDILLNGVGLKANQFDFDQLDTQVSNSLKQDAYKIAKEACGEKEIDILDTGEVVVGDSPATIKDAFPKTAYLSSVSFFCIDNQAEENKSSN